MNYRPALVMRAAAPAADGPMRFVASTDEPDRCDDIVDQANWVLDAFRRNPVFLWAHEDDEPPIGRVVEVGVVNGRLECAVDFDETTDLGASVARQYAEGFLSAVSVGFRPGRSVPRSQLPPTDPRRKDSGWGCVYYDNELLEISAVPVPANASALAQRSMQRELVARGLRTVEDDAPAVALELVRRELASLREEIAQIRDARESDSLADVDPWDGWDTAPADPWDGWST